MVDSIYEIISKGVNQGIAQLYTEDSTYNGTTITFNNKEHYNFGSYSYLGLELDPRLKNGAIDAINRFGVQYGSSRTYMSCTLYAELEKLMEEMFQAPILLVPTTTLGHVAVMPIVVEEGDVIIMDQQVHSSVQFMVGNLKGNGIPSKIVRHNDMEDLEKKIVDLSERFNRVWYMADGVYSMYGDVAPIQEIVRLLDKYKKFHLYIDDAHGMSWAGKNGTGFVLSQTAMHKKMILATSLNKAYAAGGSVFIIPDAQLCQKVRTCGGPLIFAGQHQMSALGASIACARIHLSPEIEELQEELMTKIKYCHDLLLRYNLPVISDGETPIFFVGLGLPRLGYNLVKRMMIQGFCVNLAIYPAVAESCTGIRFTITVNNTFEQIQSLVTTLSCQFQETLIEEKRNIKHIYQSFRRVKKFEVAPLEIPSSSTSSHGLKIKHYSSIDKINKGLWNRLLGNTGSFDWSALKMLETAYSGHDLQEHNWEFHYVIVYDKENYPVLATYFTEVLAKDDALAPAVVSLQIEKERNTDPYLLCSNTLVMGCPLSIGKHLHLDRSRKEWRDASVLMLDLAWAIQEAKGINVLHFRDFPEYDQEFNDFMTGQGFIKLEMPKTYVVNDIVKVDILDQLKSRYRTFVKRRAVYKEHYFTVKYSDGVLAEDQARVIELYNNVRDKSFELNLFDHPDSFFEATRHSEGWDVIKLHINCEPGVTKNENAAAIALCYKKGRSYDFLIAGLDYDYVEDYDVYHQLLWQIVKRAQQLNMHKIQLGFTTGQSKRKFGADEVRQLSFVQMKDNYNATVIHSMGELSGSLIARNSVKNNVS